MESLLFLCHRIPYPPNKGDKIRSFNILKHLSKHYRIYLGCFIDDPHDEKYIPELAEWCSGSRCISLNKNIALVKAATSVVSGKPLTLPYFYSSEMSRWVRKTMSEEDISKAFLFSSSVAQYLDSADYSQVHKVIDFVDVDSDKWRQYAEKKRWPVNWLYRREHRLLQRYESYIAKGFDASLLVSAEEANLFRSQLPAEQHSSVHGIPNGVDLDYFSQQNSNNQPEIEIHTPEKTVVFTGAMDYWANVDAVTWFVQKVWPLILNQQPECHFYIVGGNPSGAVQALQNTQGVTVTGRVADVRPYIDRAAVTVAPLQIARGIQNKVLEAMSMGKPVVATSLAMEGIAVSTTMQPYVQDDPATFAEAVLSLISNPESTAIGHANRGWVEQHFSWQQALSPLLPLLAS